jgi:hypothetical protein
MSGESECNKCRARYPSAPAGTLHKCGRCSGGICSPVYTATVVTAGPDTFLFLDRGDATPKILPVATPPLAPTDRWWAQRWIDKATPGELAAMRELLA